MPRARRGRGNHRNAESEIRGRFSTYASCRTSETEYRHPRSRDKMKTPRRLLLVLLASFGVACADEAPVSGPGTMTATLVGPNGTEGAALLVLLGDDIGAFTAIGGTEVYSNEGSTSTQVVLINQAGGELSFQVAVADTTSPPAVLIQEVAGPDDELRTPLDGYTLEFGR